MAVEHWYQLHVTTFGKNHGLGDLVYGTFDDDGLIAKVEELLQAKPDMFGRVPLEAEVIRVDIKNGIRYRADMGKWTKVAQGVKMGHLPRRVAPDRDLDDIPLLEERRPMKTRNAFVLMGTRNGGCDLWLATDKPSIGDRRKLLWTFSGRNLETEVTLFEATITFERRIAVDMLTASRGLKRKPLMKSIATPAQFAALKGKPVVGFRNWLLHVPTVVVNHQLVDGEPRLFGPAVYPDNADVFEWNEAEKVAVCSEADHPPPDSTCDCGIYAHHKIDAYTPYFGAPDEPGTYVSGVVLGTGNILIHDDGWRAQAARIVGFEAESVRPEYLAALQRISQRFDVPILPREQLLEVALKRGRVVTKRDLEGM